MSDILWAHYPVSALKLDSQSVQQEAQFGCSVRWLCRRQTTTWYCRSLTLPRQGSSPKGERLLAVQLISLRLINFTDAKSLHSINWRLSDLRLSTVPSCGGQHQQGMTTASLFKESTGLRAFNEDHLRKHVARGKGRVTEGEDVSMRHRYFILCPLGEQKRSACTFNGSRSVWSTEPSTALYLQSFSLWSMVE